VPSIGPSNLLQIRSSKAFPVWRGDLIVGSLATQSLYRLVLEGERVVLSEAIPVHRRVRDLLELPNGTLMLWTDEASIVTIEPSAGASGAALFDASCAGCHQFVDGITHRIGPDLRGIFMRDVATAQSYDDYSPALRRFGGHWTDERLDRFLRNPHEAVPGTTMAFPGIADAEQRKLIADYLHSGAAKST
jgi:cytochrome c2